MKTINLKSVSIILMTILFFLSYNQTLGQRSEDLKKQSYKAYLTNSLSIWKIVEQNAEKQYNASPNNMQGLLNLAKVQYGLLNTCLANEEKKVFNQYLEKAEKNVETLLEANERWAEVHALRAALYSLEMGFSPSKGMFLGPKSEEHIDKAIKYDATEPAGWVQKGGSKLHTPKAFGGSISEAINYYQKAIELYERDTTEIKNNWQYINTLAWLGIAHSKNEAYDKAKATYEKALKIEPEYGWVKHVLMKNLEQAMEE
ncbi:tetratricopeptide repeat protein [Salinivirga cyanobacteriivorans]